MTRYLVYVEGRARYKVIVEAEDHATALLLGENTVLEGDTEPYSENIEAEQAVELQDD